MNEIQTLDVQTPRSGRRLGFGRTLIAGALALAVLGGAGATPVAAAVKLTNGASASTVIYCSQTMQWMRATITMKPKTGLASQLTSARYYIQTSTSGFWTSWMNRTAPFTTTYVTNISNANFTVYVQYAWYANGTWTYAGEWITTYGQTQGMSTWQMGYCAV